MSSARCATCAKTVDFIEILQKMDEIEILHHIDPQVMTAAAPNPMRMSGQGVQPITKHTIG